MAQDFDKIAKLLNDMKRSNESNADNFDKILSGISSKLDSSSSNSNMNLLKAYVSELATSVEDKYNRTQNKFGDIEKALKALYETQDSHVKNDDMKELFDILSKNINNFYTEARQEKAILSGIEAKIADFSNNKTDKEDIIRTISLLRNDLGNINISYKNTIEDINSTLKSIISSIKSVDPLKTGDTVKTQIEIIFKSINDIIANLHDIDARGENIEKVLCNVVTTEDLKITNGIIDSIIEKANEIEEKLSDNAQKDDISEVQKALVFINEKTDLQVTKEELNYVKEQTENLIDGTDAIKQTLSSMAQNIENIPNSDELETNLKKLYSYIYDLADNIEILKDKTSKLDITDKLSSFKNELELIKNIVSDCNDAITSGLLKSLDSITSVTDEMKQSINNILAQSPTEEDITRILENNTKINNILDNTENISQKLEVLPEIQTDINKISDTLSKSTIDQSLSSLYDKAASIENWLVSSNIKENSDKILSEIDSIPRNSDVEILQKNTDLIINTLNSISQSDDIKIINAGIKKIENILSSTIENTEKNSSQNKAEIIDRLSDLEHSLSEIISRGEFNDVVEGLKDCILKLNTKTGSCTENVEEMQKLQKKIESKLEELDFTRVSDIIKKQFESIDEKFGTLQEDYENLNNNTNKIVINNNEIENNINILAEFIKNNFGIDNEHIKSELKEIKSLIETNAIGTAISDNPNDEKLKSVKEYLNDVKTILQDNPKSKLYSKVMDIEDSLVNNRTFNETAFSQIIDKIDHFKGISNQSEDNARLSEAISEISSLKKEIQNLEKLFNKKSDEIIDNPEDAYIAKFEAFLSEKFSQMLKDLSEITNLSKENTNENFTYKAELLEQKTEAIQKLLSDDNLTKKIDNSEFLEKISNTNNTLEDFRQEFRLASTDITENISFKTSEILKELEPIKELLNKIAENTNPKLLKNKIDDLNEELLTSSEITDLSSDLGNLHDKLTAKFNDNENNLKDFILSETDSIIIKFDNLKDYIEESVSSIVPPNESSIKELISFMKEIKNFKAEQNLIINTAVEDIKKEVQTQSDEIKSMLSIATNHDSIISAIESLKNSFKTVLKKSKSTDAGLSNEAIDTFINEDAINNLKSDFEKYSVTIEKLSDDNTQITNILNDISERIDKLTSPKGDSLIAEGTEVSDTDIQENIEVTEDDIFGEDKFDFIQAFELLQNDISNLKISIDEVKNNTGNSSKIPALNNSGLIMNMNSKIDTLLKSLKDNWLENIEEYIKSGNNNISLKLSSIESKLDTFVSDTSNNDLLNEVSESVQDINDIVSEIEPKIDAIIPKMESISDKQLSSMLEELNAKISDIASKNNGIEEINNIKTLILEQKNYIESLQPSEKLEAFKKCLDEMSFEINAIATDTNADSDKLQKTIKELKESLMNAVVSIFDQVSFIEESEDIKDFVEERTDEINQRITEITKQLQQITSQDENNNYTYTMQDIETDLAKLRLALQDSRQFDLSEISEKLHNITSSVDMLTQDEMKELKTEISNLKEQTQFLVATSDKSYNALINGSITERVDNLAKMLENSAESDRVIREALIYIGEWIDSASESINKIANNSDEAAKNLANIEDTINSQINSVIEEKFSAINNQLKSFEKQFTKVDKLEDQLVQQQERIDRLEMNINKLISIVENLDDPGISRKIDKIDKQISKLGTNIEKLASYVD